MNHGYAPYFIEKVESIKLNYYVNFLWLLWRANWTRFFSPDDTFFNLINKNGETKVWAIVPEFQYFSIPLLQVMQVLLQNSFIEKILTYYLFKFKYSVYYYCIVPITFIFPIVILAPLIETVNSIMIILNDPQIWYYFHNCWFLLLLVSQGILVPIVIICSQFSLLFRVEIQWSQFTNNNQL